MGTFGSRATAVGGVAVYQAAEKVGKKARDLASPLLEVDADDLVFSDGRFAVKGVPGRALTIHRSRGKRRKTLPKGSAASLSAESTFEPAILLFLSARTFASSEVEPRRANVEIKKYVAVDDCGKVITHCWSMTGARRHRQGSGRRFTRKWLR